MTQTIRSLLAYDGTDFRGWAAQRDPAIRTVEGALTTVLSDVTGERVKLAVAGRTDAGVHARGQVASFVTTSDRAPEHAPVMRSTAGSGPEVVALDVRRAPAGFHARFSASAREYRYRMQRRPGARSVRRRDSCGTTIRHPDLAAMRAAAASPGRLARLHLVLPPPGCRQAHRARPPARHRGAPASDRLELGFRANAFLHQMVRALTGTLVAVGEGKLDPDAIPAILARQGPVEGPADRAGPRPHPRAGGLRRAGTALSGHLL